MALYAEMLMRINIICIVIIILRLITFLSNEKLYIYESVLSNRKHEY